MKRIAPVWFSPIVVGPLRSLRVVFHGRLKHDSQMPGNHGGVSHVCNMNIQFILQFDPSKVMSAEAANS